VRGPATAGLCTGKGHVVGGHGRGISRAAPAWGLHVPSHTCGWMEQRLWPPSPAAGCLFSGRGMPARQAQC
jgi:hypothetical protein